MLRPSYETGDMDFTGEPSYATGAVFNPFGEYLYNALKHNANLFMLITGHRTGSRYRADFYQNREVFQFWQIIKICLIQVSVMAQVAGLKLLDFTLMIS